jgi:hypothetical protein
LVAEIAFQEMDRGSKIAQPVPGLVRRQNAGRICNAASVIYRLCPGMKSEQTKPAPILILRALFERISRPIWRARRKLPDV